MATPADISAFNRWYSPDESSEFTLSGTDILVWKNKLDATDGHLDSSVTRPQYTGTPAGPNNINAVTFSSSPSKMNMEETTNVLPAHAVGEVWLAARVTSNLGTNQMRLFDCDKTGPTVQAVFEILNTKKTRIYNGSFVTDTVFDWPDDGLFHIVRVKFNGASSAWEIDGTEIKTGNAGSLGFNEFVLGDKSTTTCLDGDYGDVGTTDSILSADDAALAYSFWERWTIEASSGSSSMSLGIGISI